MSLLNLQPNDVRPLGVASDKYLIVRESDDYFYIRSNNGERIRVQAGDTLSVTDFNHIDITNPHDVSIRIVYQLTRRELVTTQKAVITFANALKVSEVQGPVAISEVGGVVTVKDTVASSFVTPEHIDIPGASKVQLVSSSADRKEIILQNISAELTELMIGDNSVSVNRGLPVLGERKNLGALVVSGGGELWAFNNSDSVATLALMEVKQ